MPLRDVLRYAILTVVFLVVAGVAMKFWSQYKATKAAVAEMQSLTSQTMSFEQTYVQDAEKALYRTMYVIHHAESDLSLAPRELIDRVFEVAKADRYSTDHSSDLSLRQELVINGLLRNYEKCRSLGIFDDSGSINSLKEGEAPQIQRGPAAGGFASITHIIDSEVAPGVEKILPNFVISPRNPVEGEKLTPFEIAQARALVRDFEYARLIEKDASRRILQYYEDLGKALAEDEEKEDPSPPEDEDE